LHFDVIQDLLNYVRVSNDSITNDEQRAAGATVPRFDFRDKEGLPHAWGLDDVNHIGAPNASAHMLSHMTVMLADKGCGSRTPSSA
jgi:hypothetical protein